MADLFCETMFRYRADKKFLLHAFVVMPSHIHLLLTAPQGLALEHVVQLIKGGFSHEVGKSIGSSGPIWQKSFVDRRVRDLDEFERYRKYIHENPVRAGLIESGERYPYSSLNPAFTPDELPQRLKPDSAEVAVMHR